MHVATAQLSGIVSGTVTDSATGAAVINARVAVFCSGCYGRHPTDSTGRYQIGRLPAGTFPIEFNCPSHTSLGSEILQSTVIVKSDEETVLDVRVPPGRCFEPAYSERTGIFRGYWTPGFESSAFAPCEDSAVHLVVPLLPGRRMFPTAAWAGFSHRDQLRQIVWPKNTPVDAWGNHTYFVVWHGVLKGPGTYGHLGVSEFSMIVDSVISVKGKGPRDCRTR
jgi:hypothetical protein